MSVRKEEKRQRGKGKLIGIKLIGDVMKKQEAEKNKIGNGEK